MTTEDKVVVVPVGEPEKPPTTPEGAKAPESEVVLPQEEVDPKYVGKSLKEVIEMHKNAEILATKKAQELAELKKARPEPTVDDIAMLFAPKTTEDDDPRDKEMANIKASQIAANFKVAVLEARADESMPEWKEDEARILEIAKAKPYLLYGVDWPRDIYKLVQVDKLPLKLQEAEERGKKAMSEKESQKIAASIISEPEPVKAPPAPPEPSFEERKALYRKGKLKLEDLLRSSLSDAEKGKV